MWGAVPPAGQDCRPHRAVPTALGPWTATDSDASEEMRTKLGLVYIHTCTHRLSSSSQLAGGRCDQNLILQYEKFNFTITLCITI